MITRINRLQRFGIFTDYNGSSIQEFGRYNLIYGWNGTGKSTLSNVFSCLESRSLIPRFAAAKFSIALSNGSSLTEANLDASEINIRIFNQRFIHENIDWDNAVKSVLLIAKEKIQDLKTLENKKNDLEEMRKALRTKRDEIKTKSEALDKFLTSTARKLKTGLQAIDTSDNYYLNYDRRKLSQFIEKHSTSIANKESVLSDEQVIELTNAAKPDFLESITFFQTPIEDGYFKKAASRIRDLISTTAINQAIERLTNNPDIRDWVQTGLEIHKHHTSASCEFCGQPFTRARAEALATHFSKAFTDFQERLNNASTWIEHQGPPHNNLPSATVFYKEFASRMAELEILYKEISQKIDSQIEGWKNALKAKITDPTKTDIPIEEIIEDDVTHFNTVLLAIEELVKKHNNKTTNFSSETSKAKSSLELHFAATEIQDFDYATKEKQRDALIETEETDKETFNNLEQEVKNLEAHLSNETLGAQEFNDTLHRFIGRSELCLSFNQAKKGYEIIRNGAGEHDGNLSEGEKTAIAFVYFITKLKENGNKIENTIVVVDDPVSSFDSNHLFHAYSFLKTQCINAKQLFVLTHNFTYFKLIRDWFTTTNINRAKKSPPKPAIAFFYQLNASSNLPRHSLLVEADDSLKNYGSEYHYIFKKLYTYREKQTLNRDEAFLTANLARKLLESFFTFKFPRGRANVSQLMDAGLEGCTITTMELKEKIYKFINKYSHNDVIDITEESAENLAGESYSVLNNIFQWIEEVDKKHFDEMVEVAQRA